MSDRNKRFSWDADTIKIQNGNPTEEELRPKQREKPPKEISAIWNGISGVKQYDKNSGNVYFRSGDKIMVASGKDPASAEEVTDEEILRQLNL